MSWEMCSFVVVVPTDVLVLRLSLAWACSSGQQHLQPGEAGRANSLSARHRAQLKLYQSPECFHLGSSIGAGAAAKPAKLGHGLSTHHVNGDAECFRWQSGTATGPGCGQQPGLAPLDAAARLGAPPASSLPHFSLQSELMHRQGPEINISVN